ncbi:MAG: NUDIX hydrolase [Patescibacteria group bacterium]|nr:NUDIX hydrolase [Patescibacteria group bacterium]
MKKTVLYKMFQEVSAGGVVVRLVKDKPYFVVVERAAMKDVSLPKGHQDSGESLQQTAVREVVEETGFTATPLDYIGEFTYKIKNDQKKIIIIRTVHWFLMRYDKGRAIKANEEIKKVRWLPFDTGLKFMSYANDRGIVKEAAKKVKIFSANLRKF